jgi:hypothetical protein
VKTLAQFYPFIEPEVMGCPYPTIDHHLRLALREFCDRTKVWQEWADALTLDGTTNTFDADLASGAELVSVRRALLDGDDLKLLSATGLPADWQDSNPTELCEPTLVHFETEQFMLFPMPTSGQVLRVQQAMRPSITATQVGDILFTRWANEVACGCKARLMRMILQPWANATLAGSYGGEFDAACHKAANSEFSRGKHSRRSKVSPQ